MNKKSPAYVLSFMAAICLVFGTGISVVNYATQGLLAKNAARHQNRVLCRAFQLDVAGASAEAEPSIRQALGVYAGQPITSLDLDAIRAAGHPTATAIIVTNGDDMGELKMLAEGDVLAGTPLFKF